MTRLAPTPFLLVLSLLASPALADDPEPEPAEDPADDSVEEAPVEEAADEETADEETADEETADEAESTEEVEADSSETSTNPASPPPPKRAKRNGPGKVGPPRVRAWTERRNRRGPRVSIQPDIHLQTWGVAWDQDVQPQADPASYGDPELDPGFEIRRARVGFDGQVGHIDYALIVGTSAPGDAFTEIDPNVQIIDAVGRYTTATPVGSVFVSAGVAKIPFSREMMMSSKDLVFHERGVGVNNLAPNRDAGIVAGTNWLLSESSDAQLILRGSLTNGNGSIFGDEDPGLMAVGRLEFALGDTYQTFSYEGDSALGIGVSALSNAELATSTQALNADVLGRVGPVTVYAEGTWRSLTPNDVTTIAPPRVPTTTRQLGLAAQLSWFQPISGGALPAQSGLEAAFRVASFDDATHFKDNGDVSIWHGGLDWRNLLPGLDLGATFIHRIERQGLSIPNDTLRFNAQIRYPIPR